MKTNTIIVLIVVFLVIGIIIGLYVIPVITQPTGLGDVFGSSGNLSPPPMPP